MANTEEESAGETRKKIEETLEKVDKID